MNGEKQFQKFLLLWAGELISSIGGGLTSFGLGVYVFRQTNSAGSMALVTLLAFLPTLLLSAPAGVLADRYDRRVLMMIGDGCSAIGVVFILINMILHKATLPVICIGVFISSVFSALLEPAYRATVTDLLSKEDYSKASGMVNIAGSARYLISPLLAGALLVVGNIEVILLIDICTFFVTLASTMVVKKSIISKKTEQRESFIKSFQEGIQAVSENKGVIALIAVSSVMTCFLGTFQVLAEPMILDGESSQVLGLVETVSASGMLVSSLYLGMKGIEKKYVRTLAVSLIIAGFAMAGFGYVQNLKLICSFGFLFFLMLPFANNCLDYLVRTNIADEMQGRAWGLIGFLSQLGYVVAYGVSGTAADGIAKACKIGVGRGSGIVIILSGIFLGVTAIVMWLLKPVRELEEINDVEEVTERRIQKS